MEFCVKIHKDGREKLLAICDKEILDKILVHNGVKIRVRKEFYGNDIYTVHDVMAEIIRSTSINAFGTNICEILIEQKLVHPATVLWIQDNDKKVGHAIIVK